MAFFKNLFETLLIAGITGFVVDAFYGAFAAVASGAIFGFFFMLYLFIEDAENAMAGGIVGIIIMAICYIINPISLVIAAVFCLLLSPLDNYIYKMI